jgi:AbrB family looped-hinge helix DNA binding protein
MAQTQGALSVSDYFYGSVTLGERGQVVIPAEARKRHGLQAGDKLLVLRHPHVRGLVLACVDDMRAVLDELQQWQDLVAQMAQHDEEESSSE